jgi:hypothetical protein
MIRITWKQLPVICSAHWDWYTQMLKINAKGAIQAPSSSNNVKKMASSKKKEIRTRKIGIKIIYF